MAEQYIQKIKDKYLTADKNTEGKDLALKEDVSTLKTQVQNGTVVAGSAGQATKALQDSDGNAINSVYLKKGEAATTYATKDELNAKVSSVYKPQGSIAFASLPTPSASNVDNVYNITDAFTTNTSFVEGSGKAYPAGTNVVIVKIGDAYKYDALSGFVDLSPYVKELDLTSGKVVAGQANHASTADTATSATKDSAGNTISSTYAKTSAITDGTITAKYATQATKDGAGNVIADTYAKKTEAVLVSEITYITV